MSQIPKFVRSWPATAILLLLPMWCLGLFGRGFWTPDEPREADMAWHMKSQTNRAVPELGGQPFLEKPPLTYWMSAAAMRSLGDSAAAARLPNLLYAIIAVLAIGALTQHMAGARAALTAAVIAGSALLAWRVAIWLAPDAALVTGCSLGLLGAYRGYAGAPGRSKLLGYGLMHAGALLGFMAKSAPGWIVPALALLAIIVWERRWSELRRPELYIGLVAQCAVIGLWVYQVWIGPQGEHALRVLFWNNLAGRFAHVDAPPELDYATGHQNWPAKYFVQLPSYFFPWTLLLAAAVVCAWRQRRAVSPAATAWRFAVSSTLPFMLLLTVASTARDVYAAPVLGGFAIMVALWQEDTTAKTSWLDRFALRSMPWLAALAPMLCVLALSGIVIANAYVPALFALTLAALSLAVLGFALQRALRATRKGDLGGGVLWSYAALALPLLIASVVLFPAIDAAQQLPKIAAQVRQSLGSGRLALLDPDETTIAMMNFGRSDYCDVIDSRGGDPANAVRTWYAAHDPQDRVLVKLPGRASGPMTALLQRFSKQKTPEDGLATILQQRGAASLVERFELPHGRRYGLLAVSADQGPHRQ